MEKLMAEDSSGERSAVEEKFPRIAKVLCELWGTIECKPYLLSLVFDERGNRQGFPPDVSLELFMLYSLVDIHDPNDIWSQANLRR